MSQGTLFIVTAPSGAGKSSLVNALLKAKGNDKLKLSVSHTTRPIRPGEQNGLNYHFVDRDQFAQMLAQGLFLESAEVYGNFYGTSGQWVETQLAAGNDIILEIDWQGARQIRKLVQSTCSLFILPPSLDSLRRRLTARAQDSQQTIDARMQVAVDDISHVIEADFVVINEDFDTALADLQAIIRARRLSLPIQQQNNGALLESLSKPGS